MRPTLAQTTTLYSASVLPELRFDKCKGLRMDVFISWSGSPSQELAETFSQWLPGVIQACKPYFTPNDIEKGQKWSSEVSSKLDNSDTGLIFLTKNNLKSPWILFECGALSKSVERSRLCPILFDIDPSDIDGPLTQFQLTPFNKLDVQKLIFSLNKQLGDARLEDKVIASTFDLWWPKLECETSSILKKSSTQLSDHEGHRRSERDILEELLDIARSKRNSIDREQISKLALQELFSHWTDARAYLELDMPTEAHNSLIRLEKPISHIIEKLDFKPREVSLAHSRNVFAREGDTDFANALKKYGNPPKD